MTPAICWAHFCKPHLRPNLKVFDYDTKSFLFHLSTNRTQIINPDPSASNIIIVLLQSLLTTSRSLLSSPPFITRACPLFAFITKFLASRMVVQSLSRVLLSTSLILALRGHAAFHSSSSSCLFRQERNILIYFREIISNVTVACFI